MAPDGCAPAFSDHNLNFYHQVQVRRQHLAAAQDAHHGGAQQHVRVAALVHRAGDAGVVDFVETLHGLVAVVLPALQQVVHGHGAAVVVDVVDVVAALRKRPCPAKNFKSRIAPAATALQRNAPSICLQFAL